MPLVSVIIPCFNQAKFLCDCIRSLREQTLNNWEAIIVNDGSTDDTREVAAHLCSQDSRVRYVEQSNRGLSGARNAGVAEARGSFLQFLDSDDMLESKKLEIHVNYLERHPGIGIVYGDARYFTSENLSLRDVGPYSNKPGQPWIPAVWNEPGELLTKLVLRNITAVNCPLIRRSAIESVGAWNESLRALEDWEYWVRCATSSIRFGFCDSDGSLALIRMHASSMTRDSKRMSEALLEFRIATASRLKSIEDVRLSAARSAYAIDTMGNADRPERYLRIIRAHRNSEAYWEIVRAYFRTGGEHSRRYRLLRSIWSILPGEGKRSAEVMVKLGGLPIIRNLI